MAKVQIAVRIDEDLLDAIDELAKAGGDTRTDVIADILKYGIEEERSFSERASNPVVSKLVSALADVGIAQDVAKLLGYEIDERRVQLVKRLREQRRAGRAARGAVSKGATA